MYTFSNQSTVLSVSASSGWTLDTFDILNKKLLIVVSAAVLILGTTVFFENAEAQRPPSVTFDIPEDITVIQTAKDGADVEYIVTAFVTERPEDPVFPINCGDFSDTGGFFPVGTTTVICTVNDPEGRGTVDSPPFLVTVEVDQIGVILEEITEIWMFLREDILTALFSIQTTVDNIETEVTHPVHGLAEIKREVRNIEEVVTAPTVASFIDTETIDLDGHLTAGDFKLLMDITPFESVTGHVAMKVPCDKQGNTNLVILTGVAPAVTPLTMNFVGPLSNPGTSCLYHGDIGAGITDIAMINTGKNPVNFGPNEEGFSVTITIQGT